MYSTTFLTLAIFFINPNKINVMPGLKIAAIIISVSTIFFAILFIYFPYFGMLTLLDTGGFSGIFAPAHYRRFLHWWIATVFHRASPILLFPLALAFYSFLKTKNIKYMIYTVMVCAALFLSGTRANIFSGILIIYLIFTHYTCFTKKRVTSAFLLTLTAGVFFIIGTFLLLTVADSSAAAKEGHLHSYIEIFRDNPQYLLIGQGPGSYFYTTGFGKEVTNTELSYLDLIRMFGIFFTIAIVFIYLLPLFKIEKYNVTRNFSIAIAYLAYLFIAGTNPLLIGPTGFVALWIAYVLLVQSNNENRMAVLEK